jgi:hypothetical protein
VQRSFYPLTSAPAANPRGIAAWAPAADTISSPGPQTQEPETVRPGTMPAPSPPLRETP